MPHLSKSLCVLLALSVSLTISLVASAQSQSGKVTGNYNVTHTNMVFDARGASGEYSLSAVHTQTTGVAKGRYLLAINEPYKAVSDDVLGKEKKGSLILALARSNEGAQLTVNLSVNDVLKKRPVRGSTEYAVPLLFTKGTWADYVAGKDVTLTLAPAGAPIYSQAMGALMAKVFTDALVGGLQGMTIQTTVDSVSLLASPTLQANLRTIRIPSVATNYIITLKSFTKAQAGQRR